IDWPAAVHGSYPFLLQHTNKVYCVLEAFGSMEIALFVGVDFPLRWKKIATLVPDVAGVDPTLFPHNGRWWLAYTDGQQLANVNLFLYYADQLTGPWKHHAYNPVKTDIRSARPEGTPFIVEGRWFGPATDTSPTYEV